MTDDDRAEGPPGAGRETGTPERGTASVRFMRVLHSVLSAPDQTRLVVGDGTIPYHRPGSESLNAALDNAW
jgi:hypothetical protein